ncbi:hypothetical protein MMC06_003267 [Schaereria dolodes]|nr:hypothetical protein [Schaereria dolodes]
MDTEDPRHFENPRAKRPRLEIYSPSNLVPQVLQPVRIADDMDNLHKTPLATLKNTSNFQDFATNLPKQLTGLTKQSFNLPGLGLPDDETLLDETKSTASECLPEKIIFSRSPSPDSAQHDSSSVTDKRGPLRDTEGNGDVVRLLEGSNQTYSQQRESIQDANRRKNNNTIFSSLLLSDGDFEVDHNRAVSSRDTLIDDLSKEGKLSVEPEASELYDEEGKVVAHCAQFSGRSPKNSLEGNILSDVEIERHIRVVQETDIVGLEPTNESRSKPPSEDIESDSTKADGGISGHTHQISISDSEEPTMSKEYINTDSLTGNKSNPSIIGEPTSNTQVVQNASGAARSGVNGTYDTATANESRFQPDQATSKSNLINEELLPSILLAPNVSPDLDAMKIDRAENAEAEFELDSSPLQYSSSDTSSGSSSSEDDSDGDYEMLNPEEQARRLMQEDGGSDDESGKKGANGTVGEPLRTLNEKPDEIVEKPNVTVTPDMELEGLGNVETLVDNIVLIKARTSGEYQVLETGSILCLENRAVIGVVAETLGRVQQPLYSVRFPNASAISEACISIGTKVFYIKEHSTYVFTQPLKAFKGSDASNLHDEEVGDDELEFSDDEAEAEYKRKLKLHKQARRVVGPGSRPGLLRGPCQRRPDNRRKDEDVPMNYDDMASTKIEEHCMVDGPYTPLSRPSNLHEMMSLQDAPLEGRDPSNILGRAHGGRGREGQKRARDDRGRGGRGRGKGHNRGDREDVRDSSFQNKKSNGYQKQHDIDPRQGLLAPTPRDGFRPVSPHASMGPPHLSTSSPYLPQRPPFSPQNHHLPSLHPYDHAYPRPQYSLTHGYPPFANQNQHSPSQPFHPPEHQYFQNNHFATAQQYTQYNEYSRSQNSPQISSQLPPGSFVNPAFFSTHPQHQQSPIQHSHNPQRSWMPNSPSSPLQQNGFGSTQGHSRMSPKSDAAFKAAQEKINVLKQLSRN